MNDLYPDNATILALRAEAGSAGDTVAVKCCDRAIQGCDESRRECGRMIAAARAMGDEVTGTEYDGDGALYC